MKLSKISTHGDDKYLGSEPSWTNQSDLTPEQVSSQFARALYWYSYFCDKKQAKTFLLEYLKGVNRTEDHSSISKLGDSLIKVQLGWTARMLSLGFNPPEKVKDFFVTEVRELLRISKELKNVQPVVEDSAPTVVVSIQDRIKEKAAEEIGEIEGFIDDFVTNDCKSREDVTILLRSRKYSSVVAKKVCDFFIDRAKEIEEVLVGEDEQLVEGYSNFTKPQLKRFKELLDTIVVESNRLVDANKPVRRKRKVKEKPASLVVAKMNYLKEFSDLGLVSVAPEKVIGAMQVWTYNTKTKLLGVYNADNAKGLSVKGSTLQNFNEQTSVGKRLRKPEVVLPDLLGAGKIRIKKILPELTTKETTLTGRMNSDTIIVRVL